MVGEERDVGARDNVMGSAPSQLVRWHCLEVVLVGFVEFIFVRCRLGCSSYIKIHSHIQLIMNLFVNNY